MKKIEVMLVAVVLLSVVNIVSADTFGTGAYEFTIDFVTISGDTNPTSGYGIVKNDYRIGKYEITNDQFAKFASNNPHFTGGAVPANNVTWFEAAQFVNYLNTSTGHVPAYKFVKIDLTDNYGMSVWDVLDNGFDASNPYRNSNAKYFMPTEDEWVKAAYWNGTSLQTYATKDDSVPTAGVDTNSGYLGQLWNVGSGSEELNGTYDMMGNVSELMENPYYSGSYESASFRAARGGSFYFGGDTLCSFTRYSGSPGVEGMDSGFRVASNVPEPCSLLLLLGGSLILRNRKS